MNRSTRTWIAPGGSAAFVTAAPDIAAHYLSDETAVLDKLCDQARLDEAGTERVLADGRKLAAAMRERAADTSGIDSFMVEYDLSSHEGVVLMCLAEALLRIPDSATADQLIADKLGDANFHEHLGRSSDLLVNVSTWGLLLSGRVLADEIPGEQGIGRIMGQLLSRIGEPVIRTALRTAMRIMSEHFVMGETIEAAIDRAGETPEYRYSFDMLGEAALTDGDADAYFEKYAEAIRAVGEAGDHGAGSPLDAAGISVKLSALSPRFEHAQADQLTRELIPRLQSLAQMAIAANLTITIDAEESDRLEPTLRAFETVFRALAKKLDGHLGIAVQAYQKRAMAVLDWLGGIATETRTSIPVRLVKGAYWDTEIKLAQIRGLESFPVFTRKTSTDTSYLACARSLIESGGRLFPQFATHNPHTVAWVLHEAVDAEFEFQRLHGMGEELYESLSVVCEQPPPCRVYAPVGAHADLLPYLVRRLLENGANTSFVNRFVDAELSIEELIRDPVAVTIAHDKSPHPGIRLPVDLFGATRRNSSGLNLASPAELKSLSADLNSAAADRTAAPLINGREHGGHSVSILDPRDESVAVGTARFAERDAMFLALDAATDGFPAWNSTPAPERARRLEAAADRLESHRAELAATCVAEAGRTVPDALAEIREAVDFLRYYSQLAATLYAESKVLPGPTGESNALRMSGRGVFVCISPWNFPIAIFAGQIAAALAAGNSVIAKPAEQTPLTAALVVRLLLDSGVPASALQFLPGAGPEIGAALLPDPRVAGVAFTGAESTAKIIERTLAQRHGPIAALIAETGGINAMLVDSSALVEQVVRDAVTSAFNSAGQRCSALRLLCVQADIADTVIDMLIGRMRELVIGDPALLATDVGPVIDREAAAALEKYVDSVANRVRYRCPLSAAHAGGAFFPPTLIELDEVSELTREVFGPVLHVVRYERDGIDEIIDSLNATGYGLTLGIQSRVDSFVEHVSGRARVGNVYVNRDMIGAVVGVQPFGGMGLSGTGPKAGGPHYLTRFGVEQTLTINTAAVGGNTDLLAMEN